MPELAPMVAVLGVSISPPGAEVTEIVAKLSIWEIMTTIMILDFKLMELLFLIKIINLCYENIDRKSVV